MAPKKEVNFTETTGFKQLMKSKTGFPQWAAILVAALLSGGGATGIIYSAMADDVDRLDGRVVSLQAEVATKAPIREVREVQRTLDKVQSDVSVICSTIVAKNGGDPMRECRSHR